jgi:hypothetical protein
MTRMTPAMSASAQLALHSPTCLRLGGMLVALLLSACAVRPIVSGEEHKVDSTALTPDLTQGVSSAPFCLHLHHQNTFLAVHSDNLVEAWITEGSCQNAGKPMAVDAIRVTLRYDWYDTQTTRQCLQSERCVFHEKHLVEGRNIRCASAQARQGNQTAFITTDQALCF